MDGELGFWLFVAAALWVIARNEVAFCVGMDFLRDESLPLELYWRLPSYVSMAFSPRHQLRWTKAQWVRYAKQQS